MKVDNQYRIDFHDKRQVEWTWYSGPAIYVGPDPDDYGTGEQHYFFKISGDDDEVVSFPKSSVVQDVA